MKLESMRYTDKLKKVSQVKFGGLKNTLGAGDGDILDMQNMTGDHYPVLAVRQKRKKVAQLGRPGGITGWGKLCWVDGDGFYYGGERKGTVTPGQKRFTAMGNNIVILPDKKFYNTDTDTFGYLESVWRGSKLIFGNGKLYEEDAEANMIQSPGTDWASWFREGDAVTISGCTTHPENNKTPIIRQIDGDKLYFYEYAFTVGDEGSYEENGEITVGRTIPALQYIWENENRLWGCTERTVYASKLNDIFNWNVYDGLADDSWAIEPAAAGNFTGGVSYKGYAIPFKEDRIYKVYGSTPSTFEAMASASLGVAPGSGDSLAIAGEILFYLSRNGITAYTGGVPTPIGAAFGTERFSNAVAGGDGLKYYVSMMGEDGKWWLYVYDTQSGLWHKEDETHVTHFAMVEGCLYMLTEDGGVWALDGERTAMEGETEEDVEWFAEFADFTEESPDKKGIGKLQLRARIPEGGELTVWLQFDSDGMWHPAGHIWGDDPKRSYVLPIIPRRCDHYRVKLTGRGQCAIHSLTREYYTGSECRSGAGRN